jgi:hypothetical protein
MRGEFEINGEVAIKVSAVIEAETIEQARLIARHLFATGECMTGDQEIRIEHDSHK